MTEDRKAKLKELQAKLKALTPEQRQALANRGVIATIEGRTLSVHNTILLQLQSNGTIPTIVVGYNQWKAAGRFVKQGQHGFTIWFPIGPKNDDGELLEAERFYTGTVFDITQTELFAAPKNNTPAPVLQPAIILAPAPSQEIKQPVNHIEDNLMKGWRVI